MIKAVLPKTQKVLILANGEERLVGYSSLLEQFAVAGLIRIPQDEFEKINPKNEFVGHFNLEKTDHIVGQSYLIVRLIRNGLYGTADREEQPPVISLDDAIVAECVEIKNNLAYADLTLEIFRYSIDGIKDRLSLQQSIQSRYALSRPDLSVQQIIDKGVGLTLLKLPRLKV